MTKYSKTILDDGQSSAPRGQKALKARTAKPAKRAAHLKKTLVAFCFAAFGSAAAACPDYSLWGVEQYTITGAELWSPARFNVLAGGDRNLGQCRINWLNHSGQATGWVIEEPDFSITINQLGGYELEFRVESNCDTVLAVNTAAANWYFDDDDGNNLNGKIRFTNPAANGIYDIWIGTYDGNTCNAQLVIETF